MCIVHGMSKSQSCRAYEGIECCACCNTQSECQDRVSPYDKFGHVMVAEARNVTSTELEKGNTSVMNRKGQETILIAIVKKHNLTEADLNLYPEIKRVVHGISEETIDKYKRNYFCDREHAIQQIEVPHSRCRCGVKHEG